MASTMKKTLFLTFFCDFDKSKQEKKNLLRPVVSWQSTTYCNRHSSLSSPAYVYEGNWHNPVIHLTMLRPWLLLCM